MFQKMPIEQQGVEVLARDAHLILGKTYREIAREEGTDKSIVRRSVLYGLETMKKSLIGGLRFEVFLVVYEKRLSPFP